MTQPDVDIQLKVWKDLAISKQVLMGAATEALGLDSECSTVELKVALNAAIARAKDADTNILNTREQTDQELSEMSQRVEAAEKAQSQAETKVAESEKGREVAERQMTIGKSENNEAIKKARNDVADKQSQLKAISKALADTPENVVKKLKTLKKQKLDESKAKAQAETQVQKLKKEKSQLETDIEGQKAKLEAAEKLAKLVKDLHDQCADQYEALKSTSEDADSLKAVPDLDQDLIGLFVEEEKPEKGKKGKKGKKDKK
ncbi:MAG: colicin import membrane protein [Gammaproteobacteria bacterium]